MIASPTSRVFYLSSDNSARPSKHSIETAWDSGNPFFIEVDSHVIAVDYDDVDRCGFQQYQFRSYVNRHLKRDPVTLNSGRGIHQFLRLSDSEIHLMDDLKAVARDLGGDVRSTIRPPMSPHRSGLPVSFYMNYETVETAIERLGGLDSLPLTQKLTNVSPTIMDRILGAYVYLDRSMEMVEVMSELIREGVTDTTILQIFSNEQYPINSKTFKKPYEKQISYVASQLKQAHRHARLRGQHLLSFNTSIYSNIEPYVRSTMKFSGIAGSSQRDILLAMIHLARTASSEEFPASVRDISLIAEIGIPAVRKNLELLIKAGNIKVTRKSTYTKATEYRITISTPTPHSSGGVTKSGISRCKRYSSQVVTDLFRYTRRKGVRTLGKTAGMVFDWMRSGETIQGLAGRMGRPVANLRRYVHILESVGMISVGVDRKIKVLGLTDGEAMEIKRNLGCLGLRELYERRVRGDRRAWGAFLATRLSVRLKPGERARLLAVMERHEAQKINYMRMAA